MSNILSFNISFIFVKMNINYESKDQIKQTLSILDVVSTYVRLENQAHNLKVNARSIMKEL